VRIVRVHVILLLACLLRVQLPALTLENLHSLDLTPEKFAALFADFEFELNEHIQSPEDFLARGKGDCDDYAILAGEILSQKGYHPRLIVVFMPKTIHVVCFVKETGTYLDYNLRKDEVKTITSADDVGAIADKVALGFREAWYCAAEFKFVNSQRQFLTTEFPRKKAGKGGVRKNQASTVRKHPAPGS
jgi:hypothetical protein